ncbi:hypothetical protein PVK06_047371 [Gossypium arboreum]|uniref:Uncharacterized protein n=1 Tax=Gossypium arboreum TaxID=29729 RepID=A0ABR0MD82_GOSAR|nr:hypothetical protein PVK06_047371 [Gossypium arboreum]
MCRQLASALSAGDYVMGCDLEKDKIDGALGLADPNTNASFKKDIISSKVLATPSIGLRIQGLSGPFKMSPKSTDFNVIQKMTNLGTVVSSPSPLSGNTGDTSPKEVPPFLKIGTYNSGLSLDNSCISPIVYRFEAANQQAKGTSVTPLEKLDVTILNPKFHSAIKNH